MSENKWHLLIIGLFLFEPLLLVGQRNQAFFQKEKEKNLEKIRATEIILSETAQQKESTVSELSTLTQRIRQQGLLITTIESEIALMNNDINENNDLLQVLQDDLIKLKTEYSVMLFSIQKTMGGVNKLMFLFASSSFDQMVMRLKYMEQYGMARKTQVIAIKNVQVQVASQVLVMEKKIKIKNELLYEQVVEKNNLNLLKKKHGVIFHHLEKEEKNLKKDLEITKTAVAKLDNVIRSIIKVEMERVAREIALKNKKTISKKSTKSPQVTHMASSFEENKGKLSWPSSGFISQKFGRQNHPILKGIVLQNDGINIQTAQNEKVYSILPGEIRAVAFIQTLGSSVIISHGEYFTVYSGLGDVLVKAGQKVSTHQEIGHVLPNIDGLSELRFQIRKKTTPLDPQSWLRQQ